MKRSNYWSRVNVKVTSYDDAAAARSVLGALQTHKLPLNVATMAHLFDKLTALADKGLEHARDEIIGEFECICVQIT